MIHRVVWTSTSPGVQVVDGGWQNQSAQGGKQKVALITAGKVKLRNKYMELCRNLIDELK